MIRVVHPGSRIPNPDATIPYLYLHFLTHNASKCSCNTLYLEAFLVDISATVLVTHVIDDPVQTSVLFQPPLILQNIIVVPREKQGNMYYHNKQSNVSRSNWLVLYLKKYGNYPTQNFCSLRQWEKRGKTNKGYCYRHFSLH